MITLIIVGCEVAFWVLLGIGLFARYGLGWKRTSAVILILVPVTDLVLLVVSTIDLNGGASATWAHGLAAAYIAFSVIYGHRTIRAVDARVAHRFAGGPAIEKVVRSAQEQVSYSWERWLRGLSAAAIASALLVAAILLVGDPPKTAAFTFWLSGIGIGMLIWLLLGPLMKTLEHALTPPRPA